MELYSWGEPPTPQGLLFIDMALHGTAYVSLSWVWPASYGGDCVRLGEQRRRVQVRKRLI